MSDYEDLLWRCSIITHMYKKYAGHNPNEM